MKASRNRQGNQKIFAWIVFGCIALAVCYTALVILRASAETDYAQAQGQGTAPALAQPRCVE